MVENPPAFPQPKFDSFGHAYDPLDSAEHPGMTLRDWFAGQALAGAMACPTMRQGMSSASYASMSYELADAMLSTRSQSQAEEAGR
jgi:hypothetical protein